MPHKLPRLKTKQNKDPSNPFSSTSNDQNCLYHLRVTFKVVDFVSWEFQTDRTTVKKAQRVPECPSLPTRSPCHVPRPHESWGHEPVLMVHAAFTFPQFPPTARLLFQGPIRETPRLLGATSALTPLGCDCRSDLPCSLALAVGRPHCGHVSDVFLTVTRGLWVSGGRSPKDSATLITSPEGHVPSTRCMTVEVDLDPRLRACLAGSYIMKFLCCPPDTLAPALPCTL